MVSREQVANELKPSDDSSGVPVKPHLIFAEGKSSSLHMPDVVEDPQGFRRYMLGMLRRYPSDLKRHVQYILSLLDAPQKDYEAIYAGLLDLFIVLEDKGLALRQRLLTLARPFLSHEDEDFFRRHMESGITASTPLSHGRGSSFTRAYAGEVGFVRKLDEGRGAGFASLYDEALSLIDYGDLEEAKSLLVTALKSDPVDEPVAAELVSLCERMGDQDTLSAMAAWFMANNLDMPKCWPLL